MKKIFCLFMMICAYSSIFAQNITVKSVKLRVQDARAATQPREDKSGKKCAIIRVGVVGVDDLVFPDSVGSVERALSEYIVYVPDGLKQLRYENKAGKQLGAIVFDDYDLEIESLASYDVIFESENHLRSAIFSIQPKNAQLLFDGKQINVSADGMATIDAPVGEYSYQITADGFESQNGTVVLTEDEISTTTGVVLQEILYPVRISVFPADATVFIDNVPYTKEDRENLQLPKGKHKIRVTATNYEDAEQTIDVNKNITPVRLNLKASKQVVVKHKEEETRTRINIRNAFYLTLGGALTTDGNINLYGFGGDFSFVHHFGGIFAMREGINISLLTDLTSQIDFDGKKELQEIRDTLSMYDLRIPIQFGISIPFGKYNKHLFSAFAGGYGRWWTYIADDGVDIEPLKEKLGDKQFLLKNSYDYGLCASFKLDISRFTIGADVFQSLNDFDLGFSGTVTLGWKLYRLSFKKLKKRK